MKHMRGNLIRAEIEVLLGVPEFANAISYILNGDDGEFIFEFNRILELEGAFTVDSTGAGAPHSTGRMASRKLLGISARDTISQKCRPGRLVMSTVQASKADGAIRYAA